MYHALFFILFSIVSFISHASEKVFWETKADLQKNMLVSEISALDLVKKLEENFKSSQSTPLMVSALFEAKLDFLEFYGAKLEVRSHIELNISKIANSHNDYNIYLSKLAILHFEMNDLDKYQEVIDQLNQHNGKMYAAVVKLTTKPTKSNFKLVKSFCNNCSFYLYDNAVANYHTVLGHYSLLEEFVVKLLTTKYNLHEHQGDITGRIFLAYLYLSNKCQNSNNEYLNDIYSDSLFGIENKVGLSRNIHSVLNTACK